MLFIYIQIHATAPVSGDDREAPIFVDVVDLPPWFKGLKTPPEKPSRMSDRNMVVKKRLFPKARLRGFRHEGIFSFAGRAEDG